MTRSQPSSPIFPLVWSAWRVCASAHHWARKLQGLRRSVRLIAPQFVKPYVNSNKHDAADAEAICAAVSRRSMRFVPIKNIEQQAVLSLHRVRHGFVKAILARHRRTRSEVSSASTAIEDFSLKPRLNNDRGTAILVAASIYDACRYYRLFQNTSFGPYCGIITSYEPNHNAISRKQAAHRVEATIVGE